MKSKPIEIDERMSRKIAGLGFVCACMVVGLHVHMDIALMEPWAINFQYIIRRIFGMAVPLFFVFSGFLIAGHMGENGWWFREMKKRMRSLIIPYLFWNSFCLIFTYTMGSLILRSGIIEFGGESWRDFNGMNTILTTLGFYPLQNCHLSYLWFVRSLIVFVFVAPLFRLLFLRQKMGVASTTIMVLACSILPNYIPQDMAFENRFLIVGWLNGFLCFGLGVFLRWNGKWLHSLERVHCVLGGALAFCGILAPIATVCYGVEIPSIIPTLMLMGGLWMMISDMHVPKMLTGTSFPIYVLHKFVLFFLAIFVRATGLKHIASSSNVLWMLQIALVIACCILIACLLRKLLPRFSSLVFGGR